MKSIFLSTFLFLFASVSMCTEEEGLGKIENEKMVLTVVREKVAVKLTLTSENVKRYESISIERADVVEGPYRQVKVFLKDRIDASKDNSITDYDNYPVAVKNGGFYRIRTEEANGTMRIFPGVQLIGILQESKMTAGNFSETKNFNTAKKGAKDKAGMEDAASSTRYVEELSSGLSTTNGKVENKPDEFDKYEGQVASLSPITGNNIKKHESKNSKDIIVSSGSGINITEAKETDEPMYSTKNAKGEGYYTEFVLTGVTDENRNSPAVKEFMKDKVITSTDISLDVLIENASISTEIKLDDTEKYFQATIEFSDMEDGIYKPFKKFETSFISAKFFENKFTIIEPFNAPKGQKELFFRLKLIQSDGSEFVTKAKNVSFP